MVEDNNTNYSRLTRFIHWREKHIKQRDFILVLALFAGLLTAIAAWLLKTLIHYLQLFAEWCVNASGTTLCYLFFPMLGIMLAALFVRYIVKDDISHGITKILFAISQRKSIIKLHNVWSSIVGSGITIGFGGSVGAEAPIVLTGAAIGSNLAKLFRLDQKTMMLMIGCGAAGAIGGIFKAPIAGLVFTLEVLMMDITMASVSPLMLASITATVFTFIFSGTEPMFPLDSLNPFSLSSLPEYLLLGIICGLVSLYFTRGMNFLEQKMKRIQSMWLKILIGGVTLGLLVYVFPPLYGEGYDSILYLLNDRADMLFEHGPLAGWSVGWLLVLFVVLIIVFKIVAAVATNGGGGVGGIFAPTLFMGCLTGFVVAVVINNFGLSVSEGNMALVGMAGLMAGVMHAPLTGIFLIAEMTGGYHLFMPLMVVAVVSYMVIMLFEPHSLYAMRLAQKGELLTHNKDRSVLTLLHIENVIETDFKVLQPKMTLGELVKVISVSHRNIFPVVDENGIFLGILLLDEVRNIMFQPRLYKRFTVEQLMTSPIAVLSDTMPMEKVMEVFEDTGAWNLPVTDNDKRYIGFVSKSKIFSAYRDVLMQFSEE